MCASGYFSWLRTLYFTWFPEHPEKISKWHRKDEEGKTPWPSLPYRSSGSGEAEVFSMPAMVMLSVCESSVFFLGCELWRLGAGSGKKSPSEWKGLIEYKRQGRGRETLQISQSCQWPNVLLANKQELIWMNSFATKNRDLKKKLFRACPLSFLTPPLPSLYKRERDGTA